MRIAILYICTGSYTIFWDGFFSSCERFFLAGHEKHYFVFTDGEIAHAGNGRVHRIEQARLGWPHDTLKRFHMFSRITEELRAFEYIFFFNANSVFCSAVDESILPSADEGIVVVWHPGFYSRRREAFSYEASPASRAYIPPGKGSVYVCGGINGGLSEAYLRMIETLRDAIDADEANGVIARWHDESHINRYVVDNPHKLLSPSYCYPEEQHMPFEEKILILDKGRFGGHAFLRGVSEVRAPSWRSFCIRVLKVLRGTVKRLVNLIRYELSRYIAPLRHGIDRFHFDFSSEAHIPGFIETGPGGPRKRGLPGYLMLRRLPAGYVREIYCCHVLDCVTREEAGAVLARWHALLRPGGIVRISCLDRDKALPEFLARMHGCRDRSEAVDAVETLYGVGTSAYGHRKTMFSFDEVRAMLAEAGFKDIAPYPLVPHFASSPPFARDFFEVVDSSLVRGTGREYVSFNIMARKG